MIFSYDLTRNQLSESSSTFASNKEARINISFCSLYNWPLTMAATFSLQLFIKKLRVSIISIENDLYIYYSSLV